MKYYIPTLVGIGDPVGQNILNQSLVGKATNGTINVGRYYSSDSGVTWQADDCGNQSNTYGFFITGNTTYKVIAILGGTWKIYKSTDGGVTSTQLGNEIGSAYYPAGIIDTGLAVVSFWIHNSGDYHLEALVYNSGTSTWDVNASLSPAAGEQYLPTIRSTLYDSGVPCVYFCAVNFKTGDESKKYTVIGKWVSGVITIEKSFTDIDGLGNNLRTEFDWSVPSYVPGRDHFTKLTNNYFYLSGEIKDDAGVHISYVLLRTDTISGTWTIVSYERLIILQGTGQRVWAVTRLGTKIYLSNNGINFFPIAYNASRSWAAILEISNSNRGAMIFDNDGFLQTTYTFQETVWNDIFSEESLKLYAGSEPGIFKGLMDAADKTRFVDSMVLCVFDDSGNVMFEGKIAFTEQDEGLFSFQAVEISEELERIKPTGTYTAQTAAQILVAMINAECTFCYQSSSITSSATTYTIQFKGEKSLAQILDEFADLEGYIWYKAGDGKIVFDDGTTASGVTYDATTAGFAEPKITSEGYRIANRIEGRGKVEADGPVSYAADDLDDQTRNGVWVHKFTQPTWGYAEVSAFADNLLAARKSWSDIFSMLIEETLTLRPGTTVVMSNFSTDFGIDDGTYILMAIEHNGEGITRLVLNNNSISSKDWAREQEYAVNAMKDLYTKSDITESAAASTEIPFESEDELLARIIRHATSEANAITVIYDSTHSAKMWIDSSGNVQSRIVANAAWNFEQTSGAALFYIKATGGVGSEDVWVYLDAEDDSAILFQENGVSKAYVSWNKGNANLEIFTYAGDIVITATGGGVKITGEPIAPAHMSPRDGFVEAQSHGAAYSVTNSDTNAGVQASFFVPVGGSFKVVIVYKNNAIATCSGVLQWGSNKNDDASGFDSSENCDLAAATALDKYVKTSSAFTVENNAHVCLDWAKDDNGGGVAGTIWLYGMWLVRQ